MTKVLVVDDEQTSRLLIGNMLYRMGLIPLYVSRSERAMEVLYDNTDIVLIITDMMMPEIKGDELTQQIRETEKFGRLPIIMVSGFVGTKEIGNLLKIGVTAFLPKPVSFKDLRVHISRCLPRLVSAI
jgi:CheY-like chemotaxis protein